MDQMFCWGFYAVDVSIIDGLQALDVADEDSRTWSIW